MQGQNLSYKAAARSTVQWLISDRAGRHIPASMVVASALPESARARHNVQPATHPGRHSHTSCQREKNEGNILEILLEFRRLTRQCENWKRRQYVSIDKNAGFFSKLP